MAYHRREVSDVVAAGRVTWAPARRPAALYLLAGALAIGGYYLLSGDAQAIWYEVIGASAVIAMWAGVRGRAGSDRLAWQLFAIGTLGEVAGDIASTYYQVARDTEAPLPSIADVFYLAGYLPLVAGAYLMVRRRLGGRLGRATLLDGLIVVAAVGMVQWVFAIDQLVHEQLGTSAKAVSIAYPLADVLLMVAFLQLLLAPSGSLRRLGLLLAAVVLWVVADEFFLADAGAYGSWLDSLWLGSYVVWGAAALLTAPEPVAEDPDAVPRVGASRLVLLAGALLCAPATLAVERFEHDRVQGIAIAAGAAAIAVLVVVRLTSLLRAEREATVAAQEAREHLRRLDQQKTDFVASVSHELRTPLTSIVGYMELLGEDDASGLDAEQRRYVDIVVRNTEKLLAVVNDLLFVAGMQRRRLEIKTELVDLGDVARDAVEGASPTAAAAELTLTLEAGDEIVVGDRTRLAQLLDNLLSNAIKFTPAGGGVTVRVRRSDDEVALEVADTGIGVAAADREHVFERFYRSPAALEHAIPGTGLGLHIAGAIVESHGGRIEIESAEGQGTCVRVTLPAALASVETIDDLA